MITSHLERYHHFTTYSSVVVTHIPVGTPYEDKRIALESARVLASGNKTIGKTQKNTTSKEYRVPYKNNQSSLF